MFDVSRREFLRYGAMLSAAGSVAAPLAAADPKPAKRGSANERLRVAVVGVRSRGMSHVGGFVGGKKNAAQNTIITHVCDADEGVIGKAMTQVEADQGSAPKFVQDYRKLIENPDIDVISIATPNHWHALMAVLAMRAGKDVYVEKPVSHNVREGRLIVEASAKYGKICQTGTQSRSMLGMRQAIEYVHSGKIGDVNLAYGTCYKDRKTLGKVNGVQPTPKTMDYDLWCGPARVIAPTRKSVHYDWHWIWEYGNGDLGNQGIHEMDKARWGLGVAQLPESVVSVGGRFGYVDDGETANTQVCLYDFGGKKLIFEVRGLPTKDFRGSQVGNVFVGSEGYVVCPSYHSGVVYDKDGKKVTEFKGGGEESHFANFVKAVRSRKRTDLHADILEGHLSSALCHLGNISYRLGAETTFEKDVGAMADCPEAADAVKRMREHLTENKVDLAKAVGRVGVKLGIDPKTETFTGNNPSAQAMLFREYRKGFEIA